MRRREGEAEAELKRRVGAEIARRASVAGKKPAELAVAANVDDSQMSKVLTGRVGLSLYSLQRVATALGCSASEIIACAEASVRHRPLHRDRSVTGSVVTAGTRGPRNRRDA